MDRKRLEELGYEFHITPYGWRVEWVSPMLTLGIDGDTMLEGNEETLLKVGADIGREFHGTVMRNFKLRDGHSLSAEELTRLNEKMAIEQANVDWVRRRIRA